MKKWFNIHHYSIFLKLVLTFGVAIVPMYIAGFIINDSGRDSVKKEISQSMLSRVNFYAMSFQTEINRLITLKQQYVVDSELKMLATISEGMSDLSRTQTILSLQNKLQALKNSSLYVAEVSLYIPAIDRTIYTNHFGYDFPAEAQEDWERVQPDLFRFRNGTLSLGEVYPEFRNEGIGPAFLLEVQLSSNTLKQTLADITNTNEGGAVLFGYGLMWQFASDSDQRIVPELRAFLAEHAQGSVGASQGNMTVNGERFMITYEYMPALGTTLCVFIPESSILGSLDKYRRWYWILSLLSVGSILLFSYWIYLVIHRPLRDLVQAFRKVERGNLNGIPQRKNKDEFGYLYIQFNAMMSRLKELIHEVYEQKIRSQRAELKQLQAQINPHFLYNSFFALYQSMQFSDNEPGKRLVQHLGQYFRFITRSGSDEIALEAELGHAASYMEIQSIRFEGHISIHYDPPPEQCRHLLVPRLILQPILENACQYGVEDHTVHGEIRLQLQLEEQQLSIVIEDNGERLTDATLQRLQNQLSGSGEDRETTGIINVHRRLRLKFGDDYGLALSRSPLGGLRVSIRIPAAGKAVE